MVSINSIKRFVSNDFENAILSGRIKDNTLDLRISLKEDTSISYETISCYRSDLKKLKNNPSKLCNYLLDSYLNNNEVLGIMYFCENSHHSDKNCFEIITTNGSLTLAFSKDIVLNDLFPNFVKRLETAKQEGIISYLEKLKDIPIQHGYTKDIINLDLYDKLKTGLTVYCANELMMNGKYSDKSYYDFRYKVLKFIKDGKEIIPDYEKKFLVILIKELLEITDSKTNFEYLMERIEDINLQLENGCRFYNKNILNLGNLVSFYDVWYSRSKESLELMREILVLLKPYFKEYEVEGKQLILGGYYGINNGKIS